VKVIRKKRRGPVFVAAVVIITAVSCFMLGLGIARLLVGSPSENQPVLEGQNGDQQSGESP